MTLFEPSNNDALFLNYIWGDFCFVFCAFFLKKKCLVYYTKLGKLFGNVPFIFKANRTNAWFPGQIAAVLMTACVLKRFERHRTAGCGQGYNLYAVWKTWPGQFWGGQCVEFRDCVTRVIRLTKLKLKKKKSSFVCLFFLRGKKAAFWKPLPQLAAPSLTEKLCSKKLEA